MASASRPYIVVFNGQTRLIDAISPAAAVQHCAKPLVGEVRPAKAKDIASILAQGIKHETAGVYPEAAPEESRARQLFGDLGDVVHDETDARTWLIAHMDGADGDGDVLKAFDRMRESGRMTLIDFDEIRVAVPAFGAAMTGAVPEAPYSPDELRASLDAGPEFGFPRVVEMISRYSRLEAESIGSGGADDAGARAE
jgi:hypothetical protein